MEGQQTVQDSRRPELPTAVSVPPPSPTPLRVSQARELFISGPGYLNACTMGIPPVGVTAAMMQDARDWAMARSSPTIYAATAERVRGKYASLVGVPVDDVAIGSQTSVMAGLIATSVPDGAEVLCVDGDFSSMVYPFTVQEGRRIRVRHVPLSALPEEISEQTYLVAFSLVQSGTGAVADSAAIVEKAAATNTFTFCDITQAAGAMPVDASLFDATACNAYKWMMCPRGVAFMTISPRFASTVTPIYAGWYAGTDVWDSLYGPKMSLATNSRRFDVSPAWPSWVGAEAALDLIQRLDLAEVYSTNLELADAFCEGLGMTPQHQAIVTWGDPAGHTLAQLGRSDIVASGRNGRVRVAFHLWNDHDDVERAIACLASRRG